MRGGRAAAVEPASSIQHLAEVAMQVETGGSGWRGVGGCAYAGIDSDVREVNFGPSQCMDASRTADASETEQRRRQVGKEEPPGGLQYGV